MNRHEAGEVVVLILNDVDDPRLRGGLDRDELARRGSVSNGLVGCNLPPLLRVGLFGSAPAAGLALRPPAPVRPLAARVDRVLGLVAHRFRSGWLSKRHD